MSAFATPAPARRLLEERPMMYNVSYYRVTNTGTLRLLADGDSGVPTSYVERLRLGDDEIAVAQPTYSNKPRMIYGSVAARDAFETWSAANAAPRAVDTPPPSPAPIPTAQVGHAVETPGLPRLLTIARALHGTPQEDAARRQAETARLAAHRRQHRTLRNTFRRLRALAREAGVW